MPFSELGLTAPLVAAAQALGLEQPTPIQRAAIGPALLGRDLLACAPTGSGKTLAYALALLQRLRPVAALPPQALVLVPTRELASQVGATLSALAHVLPQPCKINVVFGGVSINPQMMQLRGGCALLVATPGRLLDLVAHNAVHLANVNLLVLDEADRLLDIGFADELNAVLALLPVPRQNLFFSATFAPAVQALAATLLRDPIRIDVRLDTTHPATIVQRAIAVDAPRRTQLLLHLIKQQAWSRVLVFVATKFASEIVADKLRKGGLAAEPLHGQLSQGKRSQVLADFKASRVRVVVATDLAARGLDIANLPVVVNYDLPRATLDYTHRIGRTGRAGEPGLAVSLVSADSQAHWRLIAKRQRLQLALESIAGFEAKPVTPPVSCAPEAPGNGGIKGRRPNKKDKLRAASADPNHGS